VQSGDGNNRFIGFDDDDEPEGTDLQTEADISCPWCGESISITLDPYGGSRQEYTEDCEICCQPCLIRVHYDDSGMADVQIEQDA